MKANPITKRITKEPTKPKRFDWLKWLIACYTIATGVWCWATPFAPLAIIAFTAGMIAMISHHKASDRISRRFQFWAWLAAGVIQGIPLAASLWCVMVVTRVFIR